MNHEANKNAFFKITIKNVNNGNCKRLFNL